MIRKPSRSPVEAQVAKTFRDVLARPRFGIQIDSIDRPNRFKFTHRGCKYALSVRSDRLTLFVVCHDMDALRNLNPNDIFVAKDFYRFKSLLSKMDKIRKAALVLTKKLDQKVIHEVMSG